MPQHKFLTKDAETNGVLLEQNTRR